MRGAATNDRGRGARTGAGEVDPRELAARSAAGDGDARRRLVELVLDRVRRVAAYLAGPGREADDLAQRALMRVLAAAGSYRGECSLEYFADRITVRTASKVMTKQRRRRRLLAESPLPEPQPLGPSAEDEVVRRAVQRRLAAVVGELPPERRTALVLRHVQGYSVAEVAKITGAPQNTVRDRLRKARATLRRRVVADEVLRERLEELVR